MYERPINCLNISILKPNQDRAVVDGRLTDPHQDSPFLVSPPIEFTVRCGSHVPEVDMEWGGQPGRPAPMTVRVGFGTRVPSETKQVIDFNKQQKRQNRYFRRFEVHRGYTPSGLPTVGYSQTCGLFKAARLQAAEGRM